MLNLAPFSNSTAVTPSDSTPVTCGAIYVGGTGTLVVKHTANDTAVTYTAVPAGTTLWLKLNGGRIMAASTATSIVALG